MSREEIYLEIVEMLGFVPSFFESLPDESIEQEWAYVLLTRRGADPDSPPALRYSPTV